uniref:MIT domain-containing protein n=1 Tax=Globodera pallida TaxID=36090 RepID=A0A183C3P4_GLOPA
MEFEQAKLALWEAVNLDRSGLVKQAIEKYIGGIEALLLCLGEFDGPKKDALRQQVEQYMSRVETLKSRRTIKVEFLEQRRILEDSTGHSYESIFAKCLDDKLTEVAVEEPWLSSFHQIVNVVKFCELLVRNCPKLRPKSLRTKNIDLAVNFEENMHDREIRFNNGWLVKMGRGLDIYKNVDKFSLGSYDYHLRPCKATLIEIFKTIDNPS